VHKYEERGRGRGRVGVGWLTVLGSVFLVFFRSGPPGLYKYPLPTCPLVTVSPRSASFAGTSAPGRLFRWVWIGGQASLAWF
jgi:hypothetical protein